MARKASACWAGGIRDAGPFAFIRLFPNLKPTLSLALDDDLVIHRAVGSQSEIRVLGTFGCLPAFNRFFNSGWKGEFKPKTPRLERQVLIFCLDNLAELREEQAQIERGLYGGSGGIHYPLMKLVDMYFFQIGYEAAATDT